MSGIDKYEILRNAQELRTLFGEDQASPLEIFSLISTQKNYTIVFHPFSDKISGMCVKAKENNLIVINSTKTEGRQRFTAAHELYHLNFQEVLSPIICDSNIEDTSRSVDEKMADIFASFFLIPTEGLRKFIEELKKNKINLGINEIVLIEQRFKVSRQAILVRLVTEGYISSSSIDSWKSNVKKSALDAGFDTSLYSPTPLDKQYFTRGSYAKLATDLWSSEKISRGEYRELLSSAYRSDLLHNPNDQESEQYD